VNNRRRNHRRVRRHRIERAARQQRALILAVWWLVSVAPILRRAHEARLARWRRESDEYWARHRRVA
jgi:hypothetical protein